MRPVALFLVLFGAALLFLSGCPGTSNRVPVANAGPNQTIQLGATVTLNGSASTDAEGDTLTFQWRFTTRPADSNTALTGAGTANPTFTPDRPGAYGLSLTVFDVLGSSTPDEVVITVTGELIVVPDLAGRSEAAASGDLTDAGLTLGSVTMASSPTVAAGQIANQDPEAGSEVAPGSAVDIVVSTGPAAVTVPNLVGQAQGEAETLLDSAGLTLGVISTVASDTVPAGQVISQSIAPETIVVEGTALDLVVSSGMAIAIEQDHTFNLRTALDDPGANNVLRPHDAAVDTVNGRAFITALSSPHVAIYETASGTISGTLNSGFDLPGTKRPYLSPDGTTLYVADEESATLARIDVATGSVDATAPLGNGLLDIAVNGDSNTVYVARLASPGLLMLNGSTLAETGNTAALDGVLGDLHFDGATGNLLILNSARDAADGELRIFDTASNTVSSTVEFSMPSSSGTERALKFDYDSASERFFVLGSRGLGVYDLDGNNARSLLIPFGFAMVDLVYVPGDTTTQRLVALGMGLPDGDEVNGRGARAFAFNPNLGQITSAIETADLGDGNTRIVLDGTNNLLLSPDSTTGTLWSLQASPFSNSPEMLHLGVDIEQLAVVNDGLFGTSRFGGNFLFRLTPGDDNPTVFTSGRWPAPFRERNRSGAPTLLVLNSWDSMLDEFTTGASPVSTGLLGTGFPDGTTERLPDLALNVAGTLAAVAYPEFGQVRVRAIAGNEAIAAIDVPDFVTGDGARGKGQLQVYFNQGGANLLYVLDRDRALLHRYDTNDDFALLGTTDLSTDLGSMDDAPPTDWLFHDAGNDRLFVGALQLDPLAGTPTGEPLPAGQVIRGLDEGQGVYWTVSQTDSDSGFTVVIHTVNRADNSLGETTLSLEGTHPIAPEFAFDTVNRRFFVAYPATAIIETYTY